MKVFNKVVGISFLIIIVSSVVYSIFTLPTRIEVDSATKNLVGNIEAEPPGKEVAKNKKGSQDITILKNKESVEEDRTTTISEGPEKKEAPIKSPYLDKTSEEYKVVLSKSKTSDGPVVINDNIYFRIITDDGLEFTKVTQDDIEAFKYEPFNTYNKLYDDLNELEEYGDWSHDSEVLVHEMFNKYFKYGDYSIIALQCRERACVLEFTYVESEAASNFVDDLRDNRNACRCIPSEHIWAESDGRRAVLKITLI